MRALLPVLSLSLVACPAGPELAFLPTKGPSFVANACPAPRFEEVGLWSNLELPTPFILEGRDPGLGVGDLDGDGDPDLIYAWAGNTQLFLNDGGTLVLGPDLVVDGHPPSFARAVALSDLDEDGDLDLLLGHDGPDPDQLFWNEGDGVHYSSSTLPDSEDTTWSISLGDFNHDGRTDVYTATYAVPFDLGLITAGGVVGTGHAFWMRTEDDDFSKVPVPTEVDSAVSLQGAVLDANQDGRLDVYMVNDFGPYVLPNRLLIQGDSGFSVAPESSGANLTIYTMGAGVGDSDGDGLVDMLLTDIGSPHLLVNEGEAVFHDATQARLPPMREPTRTTSWGAAFVDLDLDGDDDTIQAYGSLGPNGSTAIGQIANTDPDWTEEDDQYSAILVNDATGAFSLLPTENLPALSRNRAVVATDLDGDTRPDLVIGGRKELEVWHNVGGCEAGLVVQLVGPPGQPEPFGARVVVEVQGKAWTRWLLPGTTGSQSELAVFAGLGGQAMADSVTVTWPDGTETVRENVPSGRVVIEAE